LGFSIAATAGTVTLQSSNWNNFMSPQKGDESKQTGRSFKEERAAGDGVRVGISFNREDPASNGRGVFKRPA
jgi:hypothetical protein